MIKSKLMNSITGFCNHIADTSEFSMMKQFLQGLLQHLARPGISFQKLNLALMKRYIVKFP